MTPLFFIFTLCVSLSAADEDCSFTWEIAQVPGDSMHGIIDYEKKTIVAERASAIVHEVGHLECYLNWVRSGYSSDVQGCNSDLDYYSTYGKYQARQADKS